ncbi:MAG TPA: aminodeoxychorismate synthase component I [Flavobacteriaceae bacterium]|nr:aminodeoxychorismate synthase component I [Flavobacteriaceae bacterium]
MDLNIFKQKVNDYTKKGIPFLFVIDFEKQKPFVCKLSNLEKENIFYSINSIGNLKTIVEGETIPLQINPIKKSVYKEAFNIVKSNIILGNSYLTNLTFPTSISTSTSLIHIIKKANANYKLFFKNEFISFSPESFIKIKNNKIYTFPMKGTIDALINNAKDLLLSDKKETYEHNTIVDLMRNDLSIISTNVKINRFRYIDKIKTQKGSILQVSSEIEGELKKNWRTNFADLLLKILPAGSISGAPKEKTVEIIQQAEKKKRGYYTGVFGVFDGENVDSAVLIRYIEKKDDKLVYRSGGGITSKSDMEFEYNELLQKIYIPV